MPNPAAIHFNLTVESNNKGGRIDMKVLDVHGRLIETKNNLLPGQVLRIGSAYRPGTYFIHVVQGTQSRALAVVKMSK